MQIRLYCTALVTHTGKLDAVTLLPIKEPVRGRARLGTDSWDLQLLCHCSIVLCIVVERMFRR